MPLKKTLNDLADELRPTVKEINTDELARMIDGGKVAAAPEPGKAVLIDVREQSERDAGYIPRSAHLARGVLERDIEKTLFNGDATDEDLNRPIICYCRGGHRSIMTAHNLKQMGFTDVTSVSGGYREWSESGKTVEKP